MVEYRKESLPRKATAMKILSAYGVGVSLFTEGVEYTAFGRDREVSRFDQTLKMTKEASGRMEAYVGPYGVGKSFMMALFQNLSIKRGYVVMSADISRHRWFAGTTYDKQGLNLYRELIKNTAIKGKPMNAFDTIMTKWYEELKESTKGDLQSIYIEFDRRIKDYRDLVLFDDIRMAIRERFKEIHNNADHSEAMRFFMANITKKTDAQLIGAKDYIRESGWFDVLNTYSHFFVAAGYRGLIVMFDQVDYLLNLPKMNRQQNYESLLTMWNSVNEGRTEYMSVCLFAADRLLDDEKKGLPMYQAIDDRMQNATRLQKLPDEQFVVLLMKLRDIHEVAYGWESSVSDESVTEFVQNNINKTSMSGNTIRPMAMAWINYLNDLNAGIKDDPNSYMDKIDPKFKGEDALPEEFPDE